MTTMNKKKNFVIARIDDEPEQKKEGDKFVSPYGGSKTKDEVYYPHVQYGNDGKQYQGLESRKDDLNVISPENVINSKEDKYNPNRIPSYYRREEESGIKKSNIADLRGDSVDKETELERNRKTYGAYYRDYIEHSAEKPKNTVPNYRRDDVIMNPLYEETIDDKDVKQEQPVFTPKKESTEPHFTRVDDPVYEQNNNESSIANSQEVYFEKKEKNYFNNDEKQNTNYDKEALDKSEENPNVSVKTTYSEKPKEKIVEIVKEYPGTKPNQPRKKSDYVFPPLDILNKNGLSSNGNRGEINYQINKINEVLENFRIGGKVIDYTKGPTVTQFEIKLEPGVNVSKIKSISDNLQMDLKCTSIRIEAPIPGKDTVGIEVPNVTKDTILFGDMITQDLEEIKHSFPNSRNGGKPLNCVLGLSISGEPITIDIADMPHGIVAGTTGSGKTVCLYSLIISMIYKATPEEVKLILVDPKRNEFIYFEDIPHLATPVIDDPKLATATLKWCVSEMDRRYDFLKANRKRTIGDYNEYARANNLNIMPYLVVIIDEFADLMNTASDSLEVTVQRLTQKARSVGIHLIIATQRPSTDVISGTIKNNITCRIALAVKSYVDSQTILDHAGAEKLLGKGDMLLNRGNNDIRIQGAYIGSKELDSLSQYFIDSNFKTEYMFTHDDIRKEAEQTENTNSGTDIVYDPIFEEVAHFVFRNRKCSANQIQTTFEIGFNKANKIIIALAQLGIVSSQNIPGKARDVIINDIDELESILQSRYE